MLLDFLSLTDVNHKNTSHTTTQLRIIKGKKKKESEMSKIKSFTIKLDNLSAQDIVKIQNEVKNQISKTQLVAHTQATKRKREGSENNSKPERASKKPKHLEKQKVKLQFVVYICK